MVAPLPSRLVTILLAHGFSSSAEASWQRNGWLDILADTGQKIIAPDLLGHGNAPKPHDPAAYASMEDDVRALLVEEDAPFDAVGFSMGARLVLVLESQQPGTFRRIVVGGVGNNLFVGGSPEATAQAIEAGEGALDPMSRAFVAVAHQPPNDPKALAACLRREQPALDFARVTCPVVVVVGDQDVLAMPPDKLVEALPNARLVMVKGADHLGTMKNFGFLDAVMDFLV